MKIKETVKGYYGQRHLYLSGDLKGLQITIEPINEIRSDLIDLEHVEHIHEGIGKDFCAIYFKDGSGVSTLERFESLKKRISEAKR